MSQKTSVHLGRFLLKHGNGRLEVVVDPKQDIGDFIPSAENFPLHRLNETDIEELTQMEARSLPEGKMIGEGSDGKVYSITNSKRVVVKFVARGSMDEAMQIMSYLTVGQTATLCFGISRKWTFQKNGKNNFATFRKIVDEIKALKRIPGYENIHKLVHITRGPQYDKVYSEQCNGDLDYFYSAYSQHMEADSPHWTSIATQICSGIEYMHRFGVRHMDLKPGNILYKASPYITCLITDFDRITSHDQISCSFRGTTSFAPPEDRMQMAGRSTTSIDEYCVLATLLCLTKIPGLEEPYTDKLGQEWPSHEPMDKLDWCPKRRSHTLYAITEGLRVGIDTTKRQMFYVELLRLLRVDYHLGGSRQVMV